MDITSAFHFRALAFFHVSDEFDLHCFQFFLDMLIWNLKNEKSDCGRNLINLAKLSEEFMTI